MAFLVGIVVKKKCLYWRWVYAFVFLCSVKDENIVTTFPSVCLTPVLLAVAQENWKLLKIIIDHWWRAIRGSTLCKNHHSALGSSRIISPACFFSLEHISQKLLKAVRWFLNSNRMKWEEVHWMCKNYSKHFIPHFFGLNFAFHAVVS